MISLERLKEISPLFAGKSDAELTLIRAEMYSFATLALEAYKIEMVPQFPVGLLANNNESPIMNHHE